MQKKRFRESEIETLMLLYKRFKQKDSARWSDFNRFFSNDSTVGKSLRTKLKDYVTKKDQRYFLNPQKFEEVKEIIEEYHNKHQPFFDRLSEFQKGLGLIASMFILVLIFFLSMRNDEVSVSYSNTFPPLFSLLPLFYEIQNDHCIGIDDELDSINETRYSDKDCQTPYKKPFIHQPKI